MTAAELDALAGRLEEARKGLVEVQQRMDARQKEYGEAVEKIKQLEQANTDGGSERQAFKERLDKLAGEMQALAAQHTNLLETQRKTILQLGQSGAAPDKAFMYRGENSKGTIFESRQQAVELGYFFMATMKKGCPAREYARRWLKEHAQDLRYLPNLPTGLVQELGESHRKVMEACQNHGLRYAGQALAGNVTPGSALVFPTFAETFIRNVERYGAFRANALVWPMGSDTVYMPRRTGGMTPHWVGEAAAVTATDPTVQLIQMICKKAMLLHYWSSELAEDENAAIALADIVMFEIALAWAKEEDRIGFLGNGSGGDSPGYAGFTGVLGTAGQAAGVEDTLSLDLPILYVAGTNLDRTDEITRKGLLGWIAVLPEWADDNAKFFAHRTVLFDILGIETTGGGPAFDFQRGARSILGYPAVPVHCLPRSPGTASTQVAAFGDLRKAWILGDRRQADIETSEHFKFDTDQLALRSSVRIAIRTADARGMVIYKTAA